MLSNSTTRLRKINVMESSLVPLERALNKAKRHGDKKQMCALVQDVSEVYTDDEFVQKIVQRVFGMRVLNPESFEKMSKYFSTLKFAVSPQLIDYFDKNPQIQEFLDSFKMEDDVSLVIQQILFFVAKHIAENSTMSHDYDKNVKGLMNFVYNHISFPEILKELEEYLEKEVFPFMNDKNTNTLSPQIRDIRDLFDLKDDEPQRLQLFEKKQKIQITEDFRRFLFRRAARRVISVRHDRDAIHDEVIVPVKEVNLRISSGRSLKLEFDEDALGNRTNYFVVIQGPRNYDDLLSR
ncbi:hypothetical protein ACFL21_01900 [Patescibacteria group bacterium]